jgi:hypothetical protein
MTDKDDGAWFAPKTFGYGAGLPIAWQGWALLAAIIGGVLALQYTLYATHPGYFFAGAIGVVVLPLPLIKAKTRGGWKWRN